MFVRHAAHDLAGRALAGRMPGLGLNATGRAQALQLAAAAALQEVDAIHVSPQPRTQQTAQPLADRLGITPAVAAEFDEIDFGAWTGREIASMQQEGAAWTHWVERRSTAQPPGGEAFADVQQRTRAGFERLRRLHDGRRVVVFSHADVIKCVVATQLGLSLDRLEQFEVACASLTVFDAGDGWSRLNLLNAPLV
jgi:broad specificity phosphatase PhoE